MADSLIAAARTHNRSTVFVKWCQCTQHTHPKWDFLAHPTDHPKQDIDRFSHFCTADATFSVHITLCRQISPKNLPVPVTGDLDPHLICDAIWGGDLGGPNDYVLGWGVHWRHLANTVEQLCTKGEWVSPGVAMRPVCKLVWAILLSLLSPKSHDHFTILQSTVYCDKWWNLMLEFNTLHVCS